MRHFCHLPEATRSALFEVPPSEFTRASAAELLANGLGATLYCPATRDDLARRIAKVAAKGVSSMVLCLEDSVPDDAVGVGEQNLVRALRVHQDGGHLAPLLFVRVRSAEQITSLSRRLGPALASLTGFVLPKFGRDGGTAYLEAISAASASHGHRLFAMPVLESANLAHAETRVGELDWIRRTCEAHREQVLAVRIGATDLSGQGDDHLRRAGRVGRDRRHRQRVGSGGRRLHGDRPGLGVLQRPGADLPADAAPDPVRRSPRHRTPGPVAQP
jgi:hypothetical protein